VLAAAAALSGILTACGEEGAPPPPIDTLAAVAADSTAGVPIGRDDAPVTIWEFVDYQCPHCAQFSSFTGRLIRQNYVDNGGPVRWVMYDFVIGSFPHSIPAALAARCAGEQGQYWPMHDVVLARQNRWTVGDRPAPVLRDFAEELGLDMGAYDACMGDRRHLTAIAATRKYGDQLGVNSTPTIFLNGRRLAPAETSYEAIEALIQAAVDSLAAEAEPTGEDAE
jgi:protein-disulfide isomerase